jgi:ribonuclease E
VPVDVATFLLNEKRSDIHLIESRLKVSITLIPNPHMETPHYSVNRLRLDDITAEHLQASYKLVERPEEKSATPAASAQEVKAQRPQAAVKGITPAQPAPKHEAKKVETTSFFGKLFAWIFGSKEQSKPAAVPAKARPQNPRRERDNNRGERPEGGQQQGNRQRNKPRREREDSNAPRAENTQQPKPQQQEARAERPPRPPRQVNPNNNVEKPVLEAAKPVAPTEQNSEEGGNQGRKRGRRGGRRERERRDQLASEPTEGNAIAVTEPITQEVSTHQVDVAPAVSAPVVSEVESQHHFAAPTPAEPINAVAKADAVTEVETEKKIVVTPDFCVEEPVINEPISAPVTTPVAEIAPANDRTPPAPTSIIPTLSEVGLVMIETDPNKAATEVPAPEARNHAPRRRQRPREIYTAENSEPLVMIETQQHQ